MLGIEIPPIRHVPRAAEFNEFFVTDVRISVGQQRLYEVYAG